MLLNLVTDQEISQGQFVNEENRALDPIWSNWNERLEDLATLEPGWNGYKADPPTGEVVKGVRGFIEFLRSRNLQPSKLNPSVVGGVGVTFASGRRSIYLEFRNTGNAHALFTDGESKPRVEKVGQNLAGYVDIMVKAEKYLHEQTTGCPVGDASQRTTN